MKFSEYLKEAREVTLVGLSVNSKWVTPQTQNEIWEGNFHCASSGLTTLKGAPKEVIGEFNCNSNDLTSLEGAPKIVNSNFLCHSNDLTSLKGAPEKVAGNFNCGSNVLTSLEGVTKEIGGSFACCGNELTSLKDIHKMITSINGYFDCRGNHIGSHVLGLLLIKGIAVIYSDYKWGEILCKYLKKGKAGLIDCQNELIDAGLEEYAQL